MNLDAFIQKRETIRQCYDKLFSISEDFCTNNISEQIQETVEALRQDNFNIVVVGEFSRGKSTFINALLGKKVLPAATKPTTTMINKISYGEATRFVIHFRDNNKWKELDEKEFYNIVAETEPDEEDEQELAQYNNRKEWLQSIEYADIKYPSSLCKDGVEIIDTPGTNDLDIHREEITFKFLPKADVALFLLSATQILSKSELQFLQDRILGNQINKIFVIINFKDKLNRDVDKEKEVVNYAKDHLKKFLPNPKLFLVSGKQALNFKRHQNGEEIKKLDVNNLGETGFVELEQKMSEYLINERGNIKLQKHVDRGHFLINEFLQTVIKVRVHTAGLSAIQLENKIKESKPHFERTKAEAKKIIENLKVKLANLETDLISTYRSELEKIAFEAISVVNSCDGEMDADLLMQAIESKVAPLQRAMHEKIDVYKRQAIDLEIEKTYKKLKVLWDDINFQVTGNALVPIPSNCEEHMTLSSPNEDTGGGDTALILGGLAIAAFHLPFIAIPAALFFGDDIMNYFKQKKRQRFIATIKRQVDARYREAIPPKIKLFSENYRQKITEMEQNIERQINRRIDDLENQLEQLLKDKRKEDANAKKEINRLNAYAEQLYLLHSELSGVLKCDES